MPEGGLLSKIRRQEDERIPDWDVLEEGAENPTAPKQIREECMGQKPYIDRLIAEKTETIREAQSKIDSIRSEFDAAKRKLDMLNLLNKTDDRGRPTFSFDVKWLVNRIGEIRDRFNGPTPGLDVLEDDVFSFIEEEVQEKKRK